MRPARTLILLGTCFSTGCSLLIADSGLDVYSLDRAEALATFGEPVETAVEEDLFEDDRLYDEFHTRRKVSTPYPCAMHLAMTLGTSELVLFPYELYLLQRRTLFGEDLRLYYDADGDVSSAEYDGEWVLPF